MTSRNAAAAARSAQASARPPAQRPARDAIGFAVRDIAGRGCAFRVDETAAEALVFGSTSALRVCAPGVLPAHFVVLPHQGRLVAASASEAQPAIVNGAPLPATWTVLEIPSRIRIGAAAVDFFFIRESGTVLVDTDVETTVADAPRGPPSWFDPISPLAPRVDLGSGVTQVRPEPERRRPLPRPSPPPMRGAAPSRPGTVPPPPAPPAGPTPARDLANAVVLHVRTRWTNASTSTRVALATTALILIFLLGRL